ncbi:imidazole glycerol phosphate synthase subunit HisH [Carnimonas nigrificans]|uniref:imidazole glycerol phosphate synthase subunit HisH n=1 Tax=Carnimonas nigrificans TaxID=64323 RepID=UPI00047131F8|nr:imidazole glycerol phosphate synthase subunit HisH [Carnimonas nigrificans]
MTIAVIDYGMGNLHSVAKALEHLTREAVIITRTPDDLRNASRVILPGQGAMRDCMGELERTELTGIVQEMLDDADKPLLGICVGQQMLQQHSKENGGIPCLSYLSGEVKRFPSDMQEDGERLKVPHMGWNHVTQHHQHPLWEGIPDNERFYFVHSYYVQASNDADVFGTVRYGDITAHVATGRDATFAVQFHPEKSAAMGLQLLANFIRWAP